MEAFVQQQNRSSSLGKRFDYVALAPAAAAAPVGLYSLRSPSPEDPASGMAGLGHSVTIPRARYSVPPRRGQPVPRHYAHAPATAILSVLGRLIIKDRY
jgi:hypothetical protein